MRPGTTTTDTPTPARSAVTGCQIGDDQDRLDAIAGTVSTQEQAGDVAELFRLLGDPTRLRILSSLTEAGELSVGSIAFVVDTTEQKVSQALRLLRGAGIVASRRIGRTINYRLANDDVRLLLDLSLSHTTTDPTSRMPGIGTVERISFAPDKGEPLVVVDEIEARVGTGLEGDRPGANPARQVSIQSREELDLAAKRLGRPIETDQTRRNITIAAGELPRVRGQRLLLGGVELEVFSDAPPCDTMTRIIGKGARPALRRLAGIHCRVISGGAIHVGDDLHLGRPPAR